MNEDSQPQEAVLELDPRAQAMQNLSFAEQRVKHARSDRDRAVKRVEEAEASLKEARHAAAELIGVPESELLGLR